MENNSPRAIDSSDIDHLCSVQVHGVDAAVGGVGPVNFFVGPIVSDAFRIYGSGFDQSGVGGRRILSIEPSDTSIRPDLGVDQTVVGKIKIQTDNIGQIDQRSEWSAQSFRIKRNGSNFRTGGKDQIFLGSSASTAVFL